MKNIGNSIMVIIVVIFMIIFVYCIKNPGSGEVTDREVTNSNETSENSNQVMVLTGDALKLEAKESFDLAALKEYHVPILLDFGADWCPPCRQLKPIFENIYKTYKGKAVIQYIDVDELSEIANQYPVEYIPTQVLFNKDGTPYAPANAKELGLTFHKDKQGNHVLTTHVGILTYDQMEQMLKEMGLDG